MAKKQAAAAEAGPKEKTAKGDGAEKDTAKKAKAPRKPKEAKGKAEPAVASAEAPPKPADAQPAPAPAAAATAPGGPGAETKKRGRQPGHPPGRGKKLKNQLRGIREKVAKDGAVPVRRAITLLKQWKRAKFDET